MTRTVGGSTEAGGGSFRARIAVRERGGHYRSYKPIGRTRGELRKGYRDYHPNHDSPMRPFKAKMGRKGKPEGRHAGAALASTSCIGGDTVRRLTVCLAVLVGLWGTQVRAENFTIEDLYGSWTGTWSVYEMFDANGDPCGTPPYDPIDLLFVLHEYNEVVEEYGWVFPDSPFSNPGRVVFMEVVGADVRMDVEYFPWLPLVLSTITGVLNDGGLSLSGDYDDFLPPPTGFVSLQGPFEVTLVPEPATLLPLMLAGLIFLRRRA